MRKLSVLVVVLALFGLLFANQIIPSAGVRDVAAYPIPNTPTATPLKTSTPIPPQHTPVGPLPPDYPGAIDYVLVEPYGVSGSFDVVCGTCKNYTGWYGNLGSEVWYDVNSGGWPHDVTGTGYWVGNNPSGSPVYRAYINWNTVYGQFGGPYDYDPPPGCVNFLNISAHVHNLPGTSPSFAVDNIYHLGGYASKRYCRMTIPDILRDSWH